MPLNALRNFKLVQPDIGTAGQPTVDQLPLVAASGYQHVINLAMPSHDESLDNEQQIVTAHGMQYHAIPIPFDAPSKEHLDNFLAYLTTAHFENREPVFIHCIMNYRVSVFSYHYLVRVLNIDKAAAKSLVFHDWELDDVWANVYQWTP